MKKVISIFFGLLLLAACGDSGPPTVNAETVAYEPGAESAVATEMPAQSQETTEPSDVELDGPVIDFPESIVSLSPTATEMLFVIGAGEQVIAVDNFSYWPPEAPVVDDLSGWNPNVEAIAAFEPDLVILSDTGVQEELELLGIQVYVAAAAVELEDVYSQLEEIGEITGNSDGSSMVIGQMREQIKEIVEAIELPEDSLTYFHELDDTLYSVTSSTFIGQIYAMTGLKNIADPADEDGTAWGYPQLSEEFILQADPDIIFFADATCCAQSLSTISARPGWSELSAVRNGNIFEMDSDISSRWGPRLVDFLKTVSDAVSTVNAR